jgi:Protein of unknown function (DUF4232)
MNGLTRKVVLTAATAIMLGGAVTGAALVSSATSTARAITTATMTTTAAAADSVPRCYTQDLSADLRGAELGPRNEVGFILTLTNEGQRSCSLYGYPGLGLQDFNHHTLASHTFWGSTFFDRDPGRQLIVLSPGETASASLAFISGATTHAVQASYLVVTPPNAYNHLVIGPFSRAMAVPIYRGNLYVTAMARHTPYPGIAAGLRIGLGHGRTAPAASYHVSEVTSETFTPQYASHPIVTMREEGAFDPVRHVGDETLPLHPEIPAVSEIRYIGKYVYEYLTAPNCCGSDGKPWDKLNASPPSFPSKNNQHSVIQNGLADLPNDVMGGPVNPYNLLTVLESLGTVHEDGPVSGPGWTGTRYSFNATVEDFIAASNVLRPVRGTVDVDQRGRVRRLVLTTVVQPPFRDLESITDDITFSDFGAPVPVTIPPANQVDNQATAGAFFGPVGTYVQVAP